MIELAEYLKTTITDFRIDSFLLRVPLDQVEILNELEFNRFEKRDKCTGEITDIKKDCVDLTESGIPLYFQIRTIPINGIKADYLMLLINSKQLKERYFEGITTSTIKLIYNYIIGKKIVYFSYETFINSYCTDIDFKKDFIINMDFVKFIRDLYSCVKDSSKEITQKFTKKTNQGIQFSNRKVSNYGNKPFNKLYNKNLDLLNHSKLFYECFLLNEFEIPYNLIRTEFTVKDKKHFSYFGIESNVLKDVIKIKKSKLVEISKSHLNKHLDYNIPNISRRSGKLNKNDIRNLNFMEIIIQLDNKLTIDKIIELANQEISKDKRTIKNDNAYLKLLYETHLKEPYKNREKTTVDLDKLLNIIYS